MKHIVIGTAGHIDHGKTTLVKALTGRETDTLREEKERGISINLGFTFFDLPSGRRAGIIDVPGHEKFVKNMLAGVSSIDIVLLVIAADEGIMPQTREHFEILQLLNVKKGIIVLTKADLVDEEWLEMVKEEIKEEFKHTFLKAAPMHAVSARNMMGMEALIGEIDKLTEEVEAKDIIGHFRLPVDRVFTISGFGTVVTGTIISGKIEEGQTVQIYPSKEIGKIRGIQVHETSVKYAEAGQRCAINISNIKISDVHRGDVISVEELMEPTMMLDCKLYYLKSATRALENRARVRLYHGTSEIICRVVILDKEEIKPGEEAFVQLRLEKPLTAQRNDRYVIRSYSPMYTIGGGTIIEPFPEKAKRFNENYVEELTMKESGNTESIIENTIKKISQDYPKTADILKALGKNEESIEEKLDMLVCDDKIIKLVSLDKPIYIHKEFLIKKIELIKESLEKYHKENPLRWGISKEEVKTKVFGKNVKQKIYDELIEILEEKYIVKCHGKFISIYDFQINLTCEQEKLKEEIIEVFKTSMFSPPRYMELEEKQTDKKGFKMVYDLILDEGIFFKVNEECILLAENYELAKKILVNCIKENGTVTVAQLRDALNTSRKYSLVLIEHFDSIKLTKRMGDNRVLY